MRGIVIGSCTGGGWLAVSFLTEYLFPVGDWRWGITAALFFAGAGIAWVWPWPWRKTDRLGPEIRINDTTTYREQPDGSRVVTQTTHAPPVRIAGIGTVEAGGSASFRPPAPASLTAVTKTGGSVSPKPPED